MRFFLPFIFSVLFSQSSFAAEKKLICLIDNLSLERNLEANDLLPVEITLPTEQKITLNGNVIYEGQIHFKPFSNTKAIRQMLNIPVGKYPVYFSQLNNDFENQIYNMSGFLFSTGNPFGNSSLAFNIFGEQENLKIYLFTGRDTEVYKGNCN